MDEQTLKLAARIQAVEYMLAELSRMVYALQGISAETVDRLHEQLLSAVRETRAPTDDPAISDLVSAELEQAYTALLQKIVNSVRR